MISTERQLDAVLLENARLREALSAARQSLLGHIIDCGDHCEDAIAKIDAVLNPRGEK